MDSLKHISTVDVVVVGIRAMVSRFQPKNIRDESSRVNVEGMKEPTLLSKRKNANLGGIVWREKINC